MTLITWDAGPVIDKDVEILAPKWCDRKMNDGTYNNEAVRKTH